MLYHLSIGFLEVTKFTSRRSTTPHRRRGTGRPDRAGARASEDEERKAPGPDKINLELIKKDWTHLGHKLFD